MPAARPEFLFYRLDAPLRDCRPLPAGYCFELWRPSVLHPFPRGLSPIIGLIWYGFHCCRIFSNRDYAAGLIFQEKKVVHITLVFPSYFRFPFMSRSDLQFGALWTAPEHRGQGLAGAAIARLSRLLSSPERKFWYLTHEANKASQQVAQRAGFRLIGWGKRTKYAGLYLLGQYLITASV
jgi:GNAT superfamily N-acetyltransferase